MPTVHINSDGTLDPPAPSVDLLEKAGFNVRIAKNRDVPRGIASEEENIAELRGADAVIAWGECYTNKILAAVPELRVIARAGVGFDRVDVAAATKRGVAVTITPNANYEAVAEHAIALIFALARCIVTDDKKVRDAQWPRHSMVPVRGRTLGIVGLGRIGRSVATRALGLKMNVVAAEKFPDQEFVDQHNVQLVDLDTLLATADVITLHCPLTDETRGIINAQALATMKPEAFLVNTARGGLIVESDLYEALKSGQIAGAGLDVQENEPALPGNSLFELENIVFSAHNAGNDQTSVELMGLHAAQYIVGLYQGRWPEEASLNNELRENWKW